MPWDDIERCCREACQHAEEIHGGRLRLVQDALVVPHSEETLAMLVNVRIKGGSKDLAQHLTWLTLRIPAMQKLIEIMRDSGYPGYGNNGLNSFDRVATRLHERYSQTYAYKYGEAKFIPQAVQDAVQQLDGAKDTIVQDKVATPPEPAKPAAPLAEAAGAQIAPVAEASAGDEGGAAERPAEADEGAAAAAAAGDEGGAAEPPAEADEERAGPAVAEPPLDERGGAAAADPAPAAVAPAAAFAPAAEPPPAAPAAPGTAATNAEEPHWTVLLLQASALAQRAKKLRDQERAAQFWRCEGAMDGAGRSLHCSPGPRALTAPVRAARPAKAAVATPSAPGDGAPMTRAEVVAEMRERLSCPRAKPSNQQRAPTPASALAGFCQITSNCRSRSRAAARWTSGPPAGQSGGAADFAGLCPPAPEERVPEGLAYKGFAPIVIAGSSEGQRKISRVSPSFEIPNQEKASFRLVLCPRPSPDGKGGPCFKKAGGWGSVQLKCEVSRGTVQYTISLTNGRPDFPRQARGPFTHDFAKQSTASLPKDQEQWDFTKAVDPDMQTFTVCLEVNLADGS
ncbi:unnamed protein product [Prorocentrum cordatum]|uniref:Galectin n=1 Tax=Prorocentrum cordatum TaxID=2364126 RepID=A0ABN9QLJ7_9DINO|nr:unnamed protein product [Polarella glacialis]